MASTIETFARIEHDLLRDRFADFERGVLQDNIILCDGKSGVLLAFDGAMVIFCVDTFVELQQHVKSVNVWSELLAALFIISGMAFLASCHFALSTVVPRLRRGKVDHIFWEAPVFSLSEDRYVEEMRKLDVSTGWSDKLRHLHMLAGICKKKFSHFLVAIRLAQVGFLLLVAAELGRVA
jgi:hypothetical protein